MGTTAPTARSRRADRHLRLGRRWADGRPGGARPAAERGDPLHRRHRAQPLRPAADRRGAPAFPRRDGRPRRRRREDARRRLQLGQRRLPPRRPRALRRPGGRGRPARPSAGPRPPPATAGSASSAPRRPSPAAPTRTPSPPPRRSRSPARPARASSTSSSAGSPAAGSCSGWPSPTSTRCSPPASTPSSSGARTTRCSPASSRWSWATTSRWCPAPRRRPRTSTGCSPAPTCCATRTPRRREHQFLATGDPEPFARLGRRFLGPGDRLGAARAHRWASA